MNARPENVRDGGGSAWKDYTAKQVFGSQSASLVGMFGASSKPDTVKPKELEEVEAQEAKSRRFGNLVWNVKNTPAPDFVVATDEIGPSFRAEVSIFVAIEGLKEVRLLGPRRRSDVEARKDGNDLRRVAFRTAQHDPTLTEVRKRWRELLGWHWPLETLVGDDIQETSEHQLPVLRARHLGQRQNYATASEWFHANNAKKDFTEEFAPVGANWALCQLHTPVPTPPGVWYMHQRQNQEGKHFPMLFFNATDGKYYRNRVTEGIYNHETSRWVQTGVPHHAKEQPIRLAHGSACLPGSSGRKDALPVLLPELARTGAALKLPLAFMDKPASLFLLVDGLRNSSMAAEWCAKRFHTHFLPRLAACHSDPEDIELVEMVKESLEHLDHDLLESRARYAGCSLAVAVVLGCRLLVSTVGACQAMICTSVQEVAAKEAPGSKRPAPGSAAAKQAAAKWQPRLLTGNVPGRTAAEVQMAEVKRRLAAYAPLDFDGKPGEQLTAASLGDQALASQSLSDSARAVKRALRAAHPFAALGMTMAEAIAAVPGAGMKAVTAFQGSVGSPTGDPLVLAAWNRVKAAAESVDRMLSQDVFGTQQLAALCYALDAEDGIMSPEQSASLLGVEPGCGEATANSAVEFRYRAVFDGLEAACPADAARGWNILGEVVDTAARPTTALWMPPAGSRGVEAARAMGLRDLKRPRQLVGLEVVTDLVRLEPGTSCCLLLMTGALQVLTQEQITAAISQTKGRPKATCMQLVSAAAEAHQTATESSSSGEKKEVPSMGALSAFFTVAGPEATDTAKAADPKKRKLGESESVPGSLERPKRVRISHLLLKCQSMSTPDSMARRPAPKGRTQADAEKQLLSFLKILDEIPQGTSDSAKKTAAKFAELCKQHSDCKSATSGALSDLGWITPGQMREVEDVAFDLPVGGVSDIFATPRGVHILHRLA